MQFHPVHGMKLKVKKERSRRFIFLEDRTETVNSRIYIRTHKHKRLAIAHLMSVTSTFTLFPWLKSFPQKNPIDAFILNEWPWFHELGFLVVSSGFMASEQEIPHWHCTETCRRCRFLVLIRVYVGGIFEDVLLTRPDRMYIQGLHWIRLKGVRVCR